MRLRFLPVIVCGLLGLGCDVQDPPADTSDEPECVVPWTAQPCLDALEAAEAVGCRELLTEWLGDEDEQDHCVLAVALLRGLKDDTQKVLNAWREDGDGPAHAACAEVTNAGIEPVCAWEAQETTTEACLESDEISQWGMSGGLTGEGVRVACEILSGECKWERLEDSLNGGLYLSLTCE